MISLKAYNNAPFNPASIPFFNEKNFADTLLEGLSNGWRMLALTPINGNTPNKIISLLADADSSSIHIIGGEFDKNDLRYKGFADQYAQTNYFECELAENYGFLPVNHPWLRPVRKQNVILQNEKYHFYHLEGEEVHEVAVGPIHAGIIEPGHFRFQCHGELVYNLEINLGYQHRGIEELIPKSNPDRRIILAESIAGDSVIGHTHAHCNAVEGLAEGQISLRAQLIRSIAEEMERIAMHLSGLAGIANDIGFALVSSAYGRLRAIAIRSLALLCGSRFGRGLFIYGGVRFDFK